MAVDLLKFFHIVFALCLFGMIALNLSGALFSKKMAPLPIKTDLLSLIIILGLFVTASFLVIPKGYTFVTPWINVAFVFLTIIFFQFICALWLKKKNSRKLLVINYACMMTLIMIIIHDAVTKQTL